MVLSVLRIAELVNEKLYAVGSGSEEAKAAQMTHLLPLGIVQAIGEVDGMIEKRRLGGCG